MSRLTTQLTVTVGGLRGPGLDSADVALIEGSTNSAMRAAGFATRADAITFAPKMAAGEQTTVRTTDAGTHQAVAGEVRLDGSAATVAELIPNAGVYAKQASGALWRVASLDVQVTAFTVASISGVRGTVAALLAGGSTTIPSGMPNPPAAGVTNIASGRAFICSAELTDGKMEWVDVYVFRAGIIDLILWSGAGTDAAPVWRQQVVLTGTGYQILRAGIDYNPPPEVKAAWRVGGYLYPSATGNAIITIASGGTYFYRDGDPGAAGGPSLVFTSSGQTVQMRVGITKTPTDIEADARKVGDVPANRAFVTQRRNRPAKETATVIGTGLTAGAPDQTLVMVRPFGNNGIGEKLRVNIDRVGGGTFDFFPVDRITTTTFQAATDDAGAIIRRTASVGKRGWNDLHASMDFEAFTGRRTEFIGVKIPAGSTLRFVGVAGGAYYTYAGDGAVIDSATGKPLIFTGVGAAVEPQIIVSTVYDQSKLNMPWVGMSAGFVGDSFTAMAAFGQGYTKALCDATGLTEAMNKGQSGQLIATMADGVSASDLANIKLISLLGGTNDYGHGNKPLGNPTDPISKTATVCSSLKYVIDTIMTLKPSLTFVVSTPTYRTQYSGAPTEPYPPAAGGGVAGSLYTMPQLVDAMMATCQEMNVPCFNAYRNGGLNRWNILDKASDGLHPNISPIAAEYAGAEVLGRAYGRFINGIVPLY